MDKTKYRYKKGLPFELCCYLQRLFFEMDGYKTLVKEFTVETPANCDFTLNEVQWNDLLNKYNEAQKTLKFAIGEVIQDSSEGTYFVDFVNSVIYWGDDDATV